MSHRTARPPSAVLLTVLGLALACAPDSLDPEAASSTPPSLARVTEPLVVSTVGDLYAAVNDPGNAGRQVVLAPGIYMLDGTYPNGGRLELQADMTLSGQLGRADAVVLDAANLSAQSLTADGQATGAVRLGRGSNVLEWLTVRNAVNGAAGITTDLLLAGPTAITITHVIAAQNPRGVDVRNLGTSAAGRVLDVVLTSNELADNVTGVGQHQGLRVANLNGANGARIHASLSGNTAHGNTYGCLAANLNTQGAVIEIESVDDRFNENGNGCILLGGNASGANVARGNTVRFVGLRSAFEHNVGPLGPNFPTRAGIGAYGGVSAASDRAFDNRVEVDLQNVTIGDNGGPDIAAWGAISSAAEPAGTGNAVVILLHGSTRKASVEAIASAPSESAGTNTVTVVR